MANFETLLSPSGVLLYGRVLIDVKLTNVEPSDTEPPPLSTDPPPRRGANRFLQQQLAADDARFARIYGFSFEGHYYDLPRPTVFLVHGPGVDPEGPRPGSTVKDQRISRNPADADRTGTGGQSGNFADDMRVWAYDKGDFSVRLDVESGPFDQILLEAALVSSGDETSYSGAHARISGAHARISGAHARISGAHARISGAHARLRGGSSD
jgi:hypothetical protein